LILDNADTPEAAAEVEKMLSGLHGGQVLITSRLADWSHAVQTTEPLNVLDQTESQRSCWSAPSRDGRRCLQTVKMLLRLPMI
jgi:hypothetical protein